VEVFDLRKWSWSERWGNLGRAKSQDSGPSVGPVGISYRHNSPNHSPSARARSACPIPELASSHFRPNLQIITGVPSPAQRAPFPNWRVLASAEPIGDRRFPGTFQGAATPVAHPEAYPGVRI
jgi:hypothetical protein